MRTIALAVVLVLSATACGGSDDELGGIEEEIVENIIEQAAEEGVDLDIDNDDDGSMTVTFDDEDGGGSATFGGDLPDDFPFMLPDLYEVFTSSQFETDEGTMYSAVIQAPPEDLSDLAVLYEEWLNSEGFEVVTNEMQTGEVTLLMIFGERDDAEANVSLSLSDEPNADGSVTPKTNISMSWVPAG